MQIKLDELISATATANDRLIDIEELTDDELQVLHERFAQLAAAEAPTS